MPTYIQLIEVSLRLSLTPEINCSAMEKLSFQIADIPRVKVDKIK